MTTSPRAEARPVLRAALRGLVPAVGVTVAGDENWSVRGGYVALLTDGEFDHAAGARFRLRF